jgi:serine-type D-Ala-D-Ala carboxypeptidase (penicillin-binding protein 5/6)
MVCAVLFRVLATLTAALLPGGSHVAGPLARPAPPPLVQLGPDRLVPGMTARAYIAIDRRTGVVLFSHHARTRYPIASVTKMMTGLLVAEAGDLNRKIRVSKAATEVEPERDDLKAHHAYTRGLLLMSALMVSANDSAYALAQDQGGGQLAPFYAKMNAAAAELGMTDTQYASPNGLDDVHNRSSARDQAILANYALGNATFAHIVGTKEKYVRWAKPIYLKDYVNHNRMLFSYPGTYGVKTGFTTAARGCLVVAVHRGGEDVIGVVLGSHNIWQDMPKLIAAALQRAS